MLAKCGAATADLQATPPRSDFLLQLEKMMVMRSACVEVRETMAQTIDELAYDDTKEIARGVWADFDARIADLDAQIAAMFAEEPEFGERHRIPLSGRGIGEIVAAAPCCRIPGPGRIGRRRAAALAGVAPVARDSGRKAGVHRIRRDGRDWGSRSTWWPSRRPTTIWICGNRASARSRRGRHSTSKPKCNTRPRPGFVLAFFGGLPT